MEKRYFERRDEKNDKLHIAVDAISKQLADWPKAGASELSDAALSALRTSWAALLSTLDLQAMREVSECPTCHAVGMREATVCGTCWAKLTPPETVSAAATKADVSSTAA